MTDIERKALALAEAWDPRFVTPWPQERKDALVAIFTEHLRAIEQHEAFRRDVSDAVEALMRLGDMMSFFDVRQALSRFILPKPVDPLVEVIATALLDGSPFDEDGSHDYTAEATCILSAMEARGYEFTKIGEGA